VILLKRTPEKILERGKPIKINRLEFYFPKGVRHKTLRYLCHLNFLLMFVPDTPDLIKNPKECIEFIMIWTRLKKRAAYDYYNALLYINYLPDYARQAIADTIDKMGKIKRAKLN